MHEGRNWAGQRAAIPTKAGWRIDEWGADTGLSRSFTYNLLKAGRIEAVKVGKVTVIITSPRDFLAGCSGEAA